MSEHPSRDDKTPAPDEFTPVPEAGVDPVGQAAAGAGATGADAGGAVVTLHLPDGSHWPVRRLPVVIGRTQDCDIRLPEGGQGGLHARLVLEEGGIVVEQIDPAVGVQVNGDPVNRAYLADADTLVCDDCEIRFEWHGIDQGTQPGAARRRRWVSVVGLGSLGLAAAILGAAGLVNWLGPDVEPPSEEAVPALDAERTDRLRPLAEGMAAAAVRETEQDDTVGDIAQAKAQAEQAPTAWIEASRAPAAAAIDPLPASPSETDIELEPSAAAGHAAGEAQRQGSTASAAADASERVARIGAAARSKGTALYRRGRAEAGASVMREAARRPLMQGTPDAQGLRWLAERIDQAESLYTQGLAEADADQPLAGKARLEAIAELEEDDLVMERDSQYRQRLRRSLARQLEARMETARDRGNSQSAYRWAHELQAVRYSGAAAKLQQRLDARASNRFEYAFQLEPVDIGNAARVWRQVTEIVPVSSPWHRKAAAKLEQYGYRVE